MASSQREGGRKGHIPDELQQQAKQRASPVVSQLLVSARKGFTEDVIRLLQEGGPSNAAIVDKHGRTCLHLACVHGHFDTVLAILQSGLVDINAVNKRGLTALHEVSVEGHTRVALLLLAMGAFLMARTKEGWTCLMCAASNSHLQLAQILIAAGCDINASTKIGLTALHIAAWKGHAGMVEMLIRAGCNTLAQSHNGKSSLQLAQEEEQHECVTILQAASSKQSEDPIYRISSLESQVRLGQEKLVQAHHKHDELRMNDRSMFEEKLTNLKQMHSAELEKKTQKINELEQNVSELQKCLEKAVKQVEVKVDVATPENSPARRRRHRKREQGVSEKKPEEVRSIFSPTRSISSPDGRQKSASFTDLTTLGKDGENRNEKTGGEKSDVQRSFDTTTSSHSQRLSRERITITEMVAESLKNPSSIAVIRKELKADSLTPKIQRKFPMKSSPTTLPAVNNTLPNTSPLARGSNKVSPKASPSPRRSSVIGSNGK